VTIGKWPAGAVKSQNRTDEMRDIAHSAPDSTLVVTNLPVAESLEPRPQEDKRPVLVSPKLEVVDPTMRAAMQRFPTHAVNYEIGVQRATNGKEILDSSFLVEIPRAKGNGLYDSIESRPVAQDDNDNWRRSGSSMIPPRGRGPSRSSDEPRSRRFGQ
jgi:hypothetical protein